MSESSYSELSVLFAAAVGMLALSALTLLCRRMSILVRFGTGAVVALAAGAAPVALGAAPAVAPVLIVGGTALIVALASSVQAAVVIQRGLGLLRYPGVGAAALGLIGIGIAAATAVRVDLEEEAITDRDSMWMAEVTSKPLLRPATEIAASTDRGRTVWLGVPDEARSVEHRTIAERRILSELGMSERLIRLTPVSDDCNCHGWVFSGGRYWMSQDDVEHILVENRYQPVSDPRPGDLVIYRSLGKVNHTAVVRAAGEGMPVLVEGKWGWMGVFLHPVGDSMYGKNYTFYRSPRPGHQVAGFDRGPSFVGGMAGE